MTSVKQPSPFVNQSGGALCALPGQTHIHTHGGSPMAVLIQMYMPIRPLNQYTRGRD